MDGWIWIWRGWLERIDKWEEKGNRIRCPIQCLNAKVGPGVCENKQSATREQHRVSMQERAQLWDYRNPFEVEAELNWAWVYSGGPQNQAQLQSWKLIVMQELLKIPSANSSAIPTSINGSADTVSSIQLFHICKPLCNPLPFHFSMSVVTDASSALLLTTCLFLHVHLVAKRAQNRHKEVLLTTEAMADKSKQRQQGNKIPQARVRTLWNFLYHINAFAINFKPGVCKITVHRCCWYHSP